MLNESQTRRRFLITGASIIGVGIGAIGATAAAQSSSTPGASPEASPSASPGASPAAGSEIEVHTVDIAFDPKELTIPADTEVKVKVTNKGVLQHDFHVDKLDITSKLLNGGESDTVTIKAKAGEYDFWCTVPGHKEAGMVGKLTVK
ncbi:MAG TPA: cupredoxin domain-containing protein [Thermomicrobiales bacterium]|nr:cupredoxin domain-containing protein [Thermomicrobiales bacterium]